MYLNCTVEIPEAPGKISILKKGGTYYVRYVAERTYSKEKKYTSPNHRIIGKLVSANSKEMIPNENFLKYFGDVELPEIGNEERRSKCLRIGSFIVLRKIIEEYKLTGILLKYFGVKDTGLLLDFVIYSIITESNVAQYYTDYAYNHPLMTESMHIYSDSKISDFLSGIEDDQRLGFLAEWNAERNHREKIYVSYDSTNKNCQAGDISMIEFGHPKVDKGLPIFNYSVAYDTDNQEPLFYEQYPGSIVDVKQLQYMVDKAKGYGYKNIGFILDRGYFSKENIAYMDKNKYDFIIMVKGMNALVKDLILQKRGTFEEDRECNIREYKVFGTTEKMQLYAADEKDRYFHLYYSEQKACADREQLEQLIERMAKNLEEWKGHKVSINEGYSQYFDLEFHNDGTFLFAREKKEVIIEEKRLCGYFVIITSEKMQAKEAIDLYKSRDVSEKLFRGDKSYMGNNALRVSSDEAAAGKIFVEFVALIVRNKMYTLLKEEMKKLEKKPNFMTVPASIRELEKVEMSRLTDGRYHLDYALTATQKTILNAFGIDSAYIRKASKYYC